jgi:hypothetical protein
LFLRSDNITTAVVDDIKPVAEKLNEIKTDMEQAIADINTPEREMLVLVEKAEAINANYKVMAGLARKHANQLQCTMTPHTISSTHCCLIL